MDKVEGVRLECPRVITKVVYLANETLACAVYPAFCPLTYNSTFGGTQSGWIGERSVPTTWASGYVSAKSLLC